MKISTTTTHVKRHYVSRNLYERTRDSRDRLENRAKKQERRIAFLNQRVQDLEELAAAIGSLRFSSEQDPAAVRRYNAARRRVEQ